MRSSLPESRDRALPEVQTPAHHAFAQLVAAVETLTPKDLADHYRFPNPPPNCPPWHFIAGHAYEHYQEPMPSMRAWLAPLEERALVRSYPAAGELRFRPTYQGMRAALPACA